jgi:hypothetical protein
VLIGHQIKYFLSIFRKAEVEFPSKVDRMPILTVLFHPLVNTQLVVGVSAPLEKILYPASKRLLALHFTVVA